LGRVDRGVSESNPSAEDIAFDYFARYTKEI
jgi:hypothetical protein